MLVGWVFAKCSLLDTGMMAHVKMQFLGDTTSFYVWRMLQTLGIFWDFIKVRLAEINPLIHFSFCSYKCLFCCLEVCFFGVSEMFCDVWGFFCPRIPWNKRNYQETLPELGDASNLVLHLDGLVTKLAAIQNNTDHFKMYLLKSRSYNNEFPVHSHSLPPFDLFLVSRFTHMSDLFFFSQGGTPMSFSTVFSIYRDVFGSRPNSLVENTVYGSEIPFPTTVWLVLNPCK